MHTATLLRFPRQPVFTPLRAYHAVHGEGAVVAMLFDMQVNHSPHVGGHGNQDRGNSDPQQAVIEADQ